MRTITLATADLVDDDGWEASITTPTVEEVVTTFTGQSGSDGDVAHGMAWTPTVKASASVGTYNTSDPVVFVGKYRGQTVSRSVVISDEDGGATFEADGPLEGVPTSVTIPAQSDGNGSLDLGWKDALPESRSFQVTPATTEHQAALRTWRKIVATAEGNVHVAYRGIEDTVPLNDGQELDARVDRLFSDTAVGVTVYVD